MSKRIDKEKSFEEAIRSTLDGVEIAPSPQLWSRIEESRTETLRTPVWLSAVKWGGAIAASVAIAIAANIIFMPNLSIEPYQANIAEFIRLEASPISIEPIKLSNPQRFSTPSSESSEDQREGTFEKVTEEVIEQTTAPKATRDDRSEEQNEQNRGQEGEQKSIVNAPYSTTEQFSSIDPEKVFRNRRTRTYAIPTAAVAALAGGVSTIDFSRSSTDANAPLMDNSTPPPMSHYPTDLTDGEELFVPNCGATVISEEEPPVTQSATHRIPISYTLNVAKEINNRWSIESGVSYTRLTSDITYSDSSESQKQVVQLLGVPLRVNYNIYSINKFSLYTGVGAQLERCISAKLGSTELSERAWHTSIDGALGVQYRLTNWLGVYAEPEAVYYFTPTTLSTIRNESPLSFNLRFGLRFIL